MTDFQTLAPRLFRAHRERLQEIKEADRKYFLKETKRVELERLIGHRELQLVRAQWRNSARYIAERERKLNAAKRALRELMGEAA